MQRGFATIGAAASGVLIGACSVDAPRSEPLPTCDAPAEPGFEDILQGSGIGFVHDDEPAVPDGTTQGVLDYMHDVTAGVVAADFDQDGWVDLFFPQPGGPSELHWGVDGRRWERAVDAGFEPLPPLTAVASAADFDGDGLPDLAVGAPGRVVLLHNQGDRRFRDVTEDVALTDREGIVSGLSFGDADGDGDLDLFVCRHVRDADQATGVLYAARSDLWRNDVGGFTRTSHVLPYPDGDGGTCLHAAWVDVDLDGDPDLIQTNDFGDFYVATMLFENRTRGDDWVFVDRADDASLGRLSAPMGMAFRDFDQSGLPDLWFSNLGANPIFRQDRPWLLTDVSLAWGGEVPQPRPWTSWSVLDVDLAGEGHPGVFITYGPLAVPQADGTPGGPDQPQPILEQPDRFLAAPDWGEADAFRTLEDDALATVANSRGAALADLDRDGVPDLVVGRIGDPPGLLRGRCTSAHRLVVELRDPTSYNRFGIGARVTVRVDGRSDSQQMRAGGRGSFSGSDPVLLFGTGAADRVDAIEVQWPGGPTETWTDLCSDCRLTFTRPPS